MICWTSHRKSATCDAGAAGADRSLDTAVDGGGGGVTRNNGSGGGGNDDSGSTMNHQATATALKRQGSDLSSLYPMQVTGDTEAVLKVCC